MQNHHEGCCKHTEHQHEGCCRVNDITTKAATVSTMQAAAKK